MTMLGGALPVCLWMEQHIAVKGCPTAGCGRCLPDPAVSGWFRDKECKVSFHFSVVASCHETSLSQTRRGTLRGLQVVSLCGTMFPKNKKTSKKQKNENECTTALSKQGFSGLNEFVQKLKVSQPSNDTRKVSEFFSKLTTKPGLTRTGLRSVIRRVPLWELSSGTALIHTSGWVLSPNNTMLEEDIGTTGSESESILDLSPPDSPNSRMQNSSSDVNLGPSANPHDSPSDFDFLKVIGKGSFGKVLLARRKADSHYYAIKVLQKRSIIKRKEEKHIMAERNVLLKNISHPFLVGLHYSFQTTDKLYFVLDYINGGELFFHLQKEQCFLEPRARFYSAEIASAIGYLHSINIVYRDLKPENILLDSEGHLKLTDFGLCKEGILPNDTTSTFCGTPEYLAPEVLQKQAYDRTVDWWCLGSVLYEMLYGLPPFYNTDTAKMYHNILHQPLQLKPNISNAARCILEGLLQKDRELRLGAHMDFKGPSDLSHFDPEFTREPVPNSVGRSPEHCDVTASVEEANRAFLGFSYVPSYFEHPI
uniref:Protein kinase domain-containing protein n=1 Tax=Eptatretus burgeri TaxID=7764 RepID=A0A8C4QIJ9_EPTBU